MATASVLTHPRTANRAWSATVQLVGVVILVAALVLGAFVVGRATADDPSTTTAPAKSSSLTWQPASGPSLDRCAVGHPC